MNFPVEVRFKLLALSAQIAVRDGMGHLICHVKQKMFKLKEEVTVFADEAHTKPIYHIRADRMIDISAQYAIEDESGQPLGVVKRMGMRSIWRAHYEITRGGQPLLAIREENPWVRVADGFISGIPILGGFAGYVLHPAYRVTRIDTGVVALRVQKRPALFEGVFRIDSVAKLSQEDELLAVLSILMMLLLERQRA